ncbi:carboxypeptidase M32 [Candidatus Woesearchaeota archaeon]|nr:carboxypeptidase M32 [Candidatus Woesearchaeota archaeon]
MRKELKEIYKAQKELALLSGINSLLNWDQKTYMPPKGYMDRAEQISVISRMAHNKFIAPSFQRLVNETLKTRLMKKDRMILERLKKDLDKAKKLPASFVEEESKVTALAYNAWQAAKKEDNFRLFKPHLEAIVALKRKECRLKDLPGHPYNSLLDDFEEGMTTDRLKETFAYLKVELIKLLNEIKASKNYRHTVPVPACSAEGKRFFCQFIRKRMGVNDGRGRLDDTEHPFTTTIGPDDERITTNYDSNILKCISSTVHEAGHALYNLGLPKKYRYTAVWNYPSLGAQESQSRFWENVIGKSHAFWDYAFPILQKKCCVDISKDDWIFANNKVCPGLIRIAADEITYNLHIIIRFELELELIEGKLKVRQVPKAWRQKMKEYLGIVPKTNSEGCLQDVHWSMGIFGYFPTYTIGNIYAAQLYYAMLKDNPDILNDLKKGRYDRILKWLTKHVHKYGRTLSAEEIIQKTCGEGLNPAVLVRYLRERYSQIYDLPQ